MSNQNNQNESQNSKAQRRNNNFNQYVNNNNTMRSYNQRGNNNNYRQNLKQPQPDNESYERYLNQQQRSYQKSRLNQPADRLEIENNEQSTNKSKQSRLISISSSTGASINCICCLHELETYAYYSCQHFVCLNCAVKMRILCEKLDCPVCRRESKQILCTKNPIEDNKKLEDLIKTCPNYSRPYKLNPTPSCVPTKPPEPDALPNAGINFESDEIKEEYNAILSSKCTECGEIFREFDLLDQHMRKMHRKFYCELCLENLKLFPYERKHYTREDLATHKRNGDKTGEFKGHPLCHYCDNRYFDRDDLYRHYRKEHYFCHFCDSDGHEEYYKDYSELRNHFLESHYLCELDKCSYNAAETHEYVVFRNELDLQAHKKQVHAKTKSDMKTYGKINIEFNVNRDRDNNRAVNNTARNKQRNNNAQRTNRSNRFNNLTASNLQSTSEDDDEALQQRATNKPNEIDHTNHNEFPSVLKTTAEENKKPADNLRKEENKPATSSELADTIMPASDVNQTWRNLISQGNAPRINQEAEFPSLSSTVDPKTASTSLADLGFKAAVPIQSISKRQAKKEAKKQAASVVTSSTAASSQKASTPPPSKSQPKTASVAAASSSLAAAPPPGFSQLLKPVVPLAVPPPGFESKQATSAAYLKPDYYDIRNEQLSAKLKTLFGVFDESEYDSFRNLSIEFRQNKLKASAYLAKTRALLDGPLLSENYINKENLETINSHLKFIDLVQEMIVLLPDVNKQDELYKAFIEYADLIKSKTPQQTETPVQSKKIWSKNVNVASPATKSTDKTTRTVNIQLSKCHYCNQYFLLNEFESHQAKMHNVKFLEPKISVINTRLDEEYPSLSSSVSVANGLASSQTTASFSQKLETMSKPTKIASATSTSSNSSSIVKEEFPPLSSGTIANNDQTRFSALPTPSLFSNPSSHLSLVNKKKHRLQK